MINPILQNACSKQEDIITNYIIKLYEQDAMEGIGYSIYQDLGPVHMR